MVKEIVRQLEEIENDKRLSMTERKSTILKLYNDFNKKLINEIVEEINLKLLNLEIDLQNQQEISLNLIIQIRENLNSPTPKIRKSKYVSMITKKTKELSKSNDIIIDLTNRYNMCYYVLDILKTVEKPETDE